ncbi:MAG: adenylate/guanylate cyclase domain-containing protein [Betaproteobacteria bacterium]|nr:adenylate/guanylate cyclase domain-containing protein [Betaproteobacteria bacterium]
MRSLLATLARRAFSETDTDEQRLNKSLLIFASGLMGFGAMVWLMIYWAMGIRFPATIPVGYMLVSAATLGVYLWKGNFELFRFSQVTLFLFVPFIMQWSIGSYVTSSGVMLWALLAPLGVMIFQGWRESMPWFFAYVVMTAVSGFFDYYIGYGEDVGLPAHSVAVFFALNFATMSAIIYLLMSYFVRLRERLERRLAEQHRLLQIEQEKSERLLLNILPQPIARRLKDDQSTIGDGFSDVTVMFADIINFTRLSEAMPPRYLVSLLNEVFSHFDVLAEKYGLEKIKTIGDAYMVAGGLNEDHRDYSDAIASLALEMRDYMASRSGVHAQKLQIHIGIGSGPVVAGVIGTKKFIYDLWGDTVNIANRVTAEAAADTILCDAATYRRLRERYEFEGPLTLHIKGKGDMVAYRLIGKPSPG